MKILLVPTLLFMALCLQAQNKRGDCAAETIDKAVIAMGGKSALEAIQNMKFSGYGYHNALEQSERFEGPYIPTLFDFSTLLDFTDSLEKYHIEERMFTFNSDLQYLVNGKLVAMRTQGQTMSCPQDQTAVDDLYLNPISILARAVSHFSLQCLPDSVIQGVPNKRIHFLWNQFPVTVSINAFTWLPTCVEIVKPYSDSFLGIWGDQKKVVQYSFWDLLENGVSYPRQKDVYFLDRLWESTLITRVDINQPFSRDSIRIQDPVLASSRNFSKETEIKFRKGFERKIEIAKDVWLLPGPCNSTIIKQEDGIVILESPNTSINTDLILEQAHNLFPGVKLKSVVTTSDAWLHFGGLRSAALAGEVIALKENREVVQRLLTARYLTYPDKWQKAKSPNPTIRYVEKRLTIGTGVNRLELIPFRTEAGERMMMAYFPGLKMLYASDLLQPGNWEKHYTLEVIQSVVREKLAVEFVYAMHMKPLKYADVVDQMQAYLPK